MKQRIGALALFAAASVLAGGSGSAQGISPNPYPIFARAEQVWELQRYPNVVNYVVHVQTVRHGKSEERHYQTRWFALSNDIVVDRISIEEREHPYKPPPGFDVSFFGLRLGHVGGPSEGTGTNGDLIGVPGLAPNYSFGVARYIPPAELTPAQLVAEIRKEYNDPAPDKVARLEAEYGLRTIATVFASSAAYNISLAGMDRIDGHVDYHLSLAPKREPSKFRLRDVWINQQTYELDKLRSDGNFLNSTTSSVPWIVTFQSVAGTQYIKREVTEKPIAHWFDSISISFEDLTAGQGHFDGGSAEGSTIREP